MISASDSKSNCVAHIYNKGSQNERPPILNVKQEKLIVKEALHHLGNKRPLSKLDLLYVISFDV